MNISTCHRRSRTPLALLAAGGVAAALMATSAAPASADPHTTSHAKPTVVLVHGAFADSSGWNGVVKKLKHEGYPVVAAANPLRGLSSDSAYLKDVLAGIKGPVVLAGHSYGGAVISNAATGNKNVKALVYVAAFVPEKGESALDLAARFPGSTLGQALHPVPVTNPDGSRGADLYIQEGKFGSQFAADVSRGTAELMAVAQRPVTEAALAEKSSEPAWKTIPTWDLVATQDLNIPPKAQAFMAERAGAHTVEVKASHAVHVSRPDKVTEIIVDAARTVR
ncbi:alpha/beta fold hydrolase [Streptomyces sp. NPDC057757]|uniref:alpha/beta fold hydrolase n=1 Tax=Streptomyces sp. NPDC057757 TaxID=3346241 RepID=UPI0036842F8F